MEGYLDHNRWHQSFYDKVDPAKRARFPRRYPLLFLSLVSLPHTVGIVPGLLLLIAGRFSGCWSVQHKANKIEERSGRDKMREMVQSRGEEPGCAGLPWSVIRLWKVNK